MEPNEQAEKKAYSDDAQAELRAKLKQEILDDMKARRALRPKYLIPDSRFTRSEFAIKLTKVGYYLGCMLPKDVAMAMKLRRGQMLKCTIEMYPEDAARLYNDSLNIALDEVVPNEPKL